MQCLLAAVLLFAALRDLNITTIWHKQVDHLVYHPVTPFMTAFWGVPSFHAFLDQHRKHRERERDGGKPAPTPSRFDIGHQTLHPVCIDHPRVE